ncbi:unnamed protein product [Periconia digitata]|uniref:Uncharacterized protein n=1 Tax=Periconia digitata TaxID=1303443 RepID=A0A9W4UK99_9PLEO|nr:unnamed protein product [Periconia digitata]
MSCVLDAARRTRLRRPTSRLASHPLFSPNLTVLTPQHMMSIASQVKQRACLSELRPTRRYAHNQLSDFELNNHGRIPMASTANPPTPVPSLVPYWPAPRRSTTDFYQVLAPHYKSFSQISSASRPPDTTDKLFAAMQPLPSPRLPGVTILRAEASGPEYSRWRREVKAVFTAKGIWGHCDGSSPMPMPEAGPNFFSPASPSNPQPQLLEQRKAWVKRDRDVKLDIFLSVSDDIKLEVFDVGPPLPPVSLTAKEMMEAMDERFAEFKFEDYHHVFCHFLNLHIDQYSTIEDFNAEYQATLNDLLDHGHPMSNVQACSAYFSKLRCTQNPWVMKKLKEWDGLELEPQLEHLMQQSPPWSIIKPLNSAPNKPSQSSHSLPDSIPEEHLEDTPHHSDGEYAPSERSVASSTSSRSSKYSQRTYQHTRDISVATTRSQEITIHASYDDLSDIHAFPTVPAPPLPSTNIPKRGSSMANISNMAARPPPINRPLPPLPPNASPTPSERAVSPQPSITHSVESGKSVKKVQLPVLLPPKSFTGSTENIHPALRSSTPRSVPEDDQGQADIHPALRNTSPVQSSINTPPQIVETVVTVPTPSNEDASNAQSPPPAMSPTIASPRFSTVMSLFPAPLSSAAYQRPSSSRSAVQPPPLRTTSPLANSSEDSTLNSPPFNLNSSSSSTWSLPLQGISLPDHMDGPEYKDSLITEHRSSTAEATPPSPTPANKPVSKIEQARMRFEGGIGTRRTSGSPPRALMSPSLSYLSEEEKKSRKRSWNIKAKLSARHGIKEII